MSITPHGNPETIEKTCEWTGIPFTVDWKHRNQRFIDRNAMYSWRKSQNRETVNCLNCGKPFERYKRILHPRNHKLTQYCSNDCSTKSEYHRKKARDWTIKNQPMNSEKSRLKISETKLKRYGDSSYNNQEKCIKTCLEKYGVSHFFNSPKAIKSNGKRISKFQKRVYEEVMKRYPDSILEKYLEDVRCSVDIYIPSTNKIIECHGDYWHCNPIKCSPDYYNKAMKMTAQEVWDRDNDKKIKLERAGYTVEIVWESSKKKFVHSTKL